MVKDMKTVSDLCLLSRYLNVILENTIMFIYLR